MMSEAITREKEHFIAHYESHQSLFNDCADLLPKLLRAILPRRLDLVLTTRVKPLDNCLKKIDRKYQREIEAGERAASLITDVIGARVVCLYQDEVDAIIKALRSDAAFEFVERHCVDKITELEEIPGLFGYRAVHVVASLGASRTRLQEYERYRELIFEIQVRTIVQDAWASIERKIGYDKEIAREFRRRLLTLAALFELADREFLTLRDTISGSLDASE
ncbi:GTP pyrophosphokinase family protein [Bradyrhizobium liaoningense]|uniref:GTP pyrophosphokinase n=1 Tax=Bradyrhizobium liaoningense TaxID=43992 RepID=UPI001BAA4C08|nr:hypothetical protein [Bradyrhizobium liaoningense]MBR1070497.1 hypothetical protein [Bradyrhizobium liaoningense]